MTETALIVGAGPGLSSSLTYLLLKNKFKVAIAARNVVKLATLAETSNVDVFACDASNINQVQTLFKKLDKTLGTPDLVIYNPSARVRGGIVEVDPEDTQKAINITCFGAFLVAQEAAKRMVKRGSGSIFFTGASASVKGYANSSVFAMGKFGLRGLAQALARELHPQNIHIGHFIIDGGIKADHRPERNDPGDDSMLDPEAIANTYLQFHRQNRSSWSWEIELRPWLETF
ncbi:MAG: oxidoreductase [Rhodospirillaceae bacterium]|jgi:NAD(P)-dependent dehydrogenase (short-subunit alcohol dehydrogenase family)|nr:oxidoreductase [Rhodospirillaceae bacterium]|tara:strand:+ start:1419 stop:2111 length:693 start_codon:yes stop_codon:yes gene_type:complete